MSCNSQMKAPERTKPGSCRWKRRRVSKRSKEFQICAIAPGCQAKISKTFQLAELFQRGLCAAWSVVAVRVEPGRPTAGCKSWKGGPAKPRGYVIKTLDALAGAGVLRRHCERDPIPAHTGDGSGRSDGDVSSYRSSPQGPNLSASARWVWASCGLRSGSELSYRLIKEAYSLLIEGK